MYVPFTPATPVIPDYLSESSSRVFESQRIEDAQTPIPIGLIPAPSQAFPLLPGQSKYANGDGTYRLYNNGTPLGTLEFDESTGEWIFISEVTIPLESGQELFEGIRIPTGLLGIIIAGDGKWALINLIAAMFALAATLGMFVVFLTRKRLKKADEAKDSINEEALLLEELLQEENLTAEQQYEVGLLEIRVQKALLLDKKQKEEHDLEVKHRRKQQRYALGSTFGVIIGFLLFILTQDTSLEIAMIDRWTVIHAGLFIFSVYALSRMKRRKKKEDAQTELQEEHLIEEELIDMGAVTHTA